MVDVADIKKDLPAWPDDVIDQWLLYFANEPECGWPPRICSGPSLGEDSRAEAAFVVARGDVENGKGEM